MLGLETWKTTLGENNPVYATGLNSLAVLHSDQGAHARAEPLFRQAAAIMRRHLETCSVIQSERQQLATLQSTRHYLDNYLALAVRSNGYTEGAYQEMLAWKGSVLRRQRQVRAAGESPETAAVFNQLQRVVTQWARLAQAAPDPN